MLFLFTISIFAFSYINVPTTEIREEPNSEAAVVSDLFFSEQVEVVEPLEHPEQPDASWIHIQTSNDNIKGWIKKDTFYKKDGSYPATNAIVAKVKNKSVNLYKVADTIFGPIFRLPFESKLEVLDQSDARWIKVRLPDNKEAYIQRGDIEFESKKLTLEEMCVFSKKFLKLPYTWGGRSSFGYDCSGFIQMLFRQMGISIPRSSRTQIKWTGFNEVKLNEIQRGDLIYWGLEEEKIRHVGLYLGNNEFIHATIAENEPYIHISKFSDPEWNGSQALKYIAIRRLIK